MGLFISMQGIAHIGSNLCVDWMDIPLSIPFCVGGIQNLATISQWWIVSMDKHLGKSCRDNGIYLA
jgi:hypothetical protein